MSFQVVNLGSIAHEFVVLKTDLPADGLPVTGVAADETGWGEVAGRIDQESLGRGQRATATFDLGPGTYVLLCNLATHYGLGMYAAFTVTE